VAGASVPFTSGVPNATGVRVGLLSASGATRWTTATVTSTGPTLTIGFATPVVGSGLVVAGGGAAGATDATTVTTASGARYVMDGFLQSALRDASFRFTGYRQGIPVFRTARTARPVSLVARGATAGAVAPGARSLGTAHRVGLTSWGRETDTVTAHRPVTLVRSEAYSAGWRADVRDTATGRHATVAVVRVGLVQGIRLAPGTYTVTWSYQPTSVTVGLLGSAAGALVVVGAGTSWFWRRRSQRRRPSSPVRVTATPRAPTASSGAATRA
jgi:hypothetical protein